MPEGRPEARMTVTDCDWLEETVAIFRARCVFQPIRVADPNDDDEFYYWAKYRGFGSPPGSDEAIT
jgi:hypothetical protein